MPPPQSLSLGPTPLKAKQPRFRSKPEASLRLGRSPPLSLFLLKTVLVLCPGEECSQKGCLPPPQCPRPPSRMVMVMAMGKTSREVRLAWGSPCLSWSHRVWGFLWQSLARQPPSCLLGPHRGWRPLHRTPPPGERLVTWSQAHTSVPHARGTGLLSPGISEAHIHSHVYIIQNPDLPCLASDITGPHPELSLGSVPPTGQPAVPPTPGPWLPQR